MTVKVSISLTDEQHAFVRTLVETGRFPSISGVLRQSVELLRVQMEADALERAALANVLTRRRAGQFVSDSAMHARLTRMLARKRRAHVAPR